MKHSGSRHCGRIAFELKAEIAEVVDCNCSLCRRRGGLLWFGPRDALTLTTPDSDVSDYSCNEYHLQHHFCGHCGVSPCSKGENPSTGSKMVAVNVRCLPDVDLKSLKVSEFDGANL